MGSLFLEELDLCHLVLQLLWKIDLATSLLLKQFRPLEFFYLLYCHVVLIRNIHLQIKEEEEEEEEGPWHL
jgi:hypothetical protein